MKSVNLNQLLSHPKKASLSFFQPSLKNHSEQAFDEFVEGMVVQLELQAKPAIAQLLRNSKAKVKNILKCHPHHSCGFFFSEDLQGYTLLENPVEAFCIIGSSFHVRPIIEEFFVNPEFLVVNVSFYDIKVFRGNFHHLEIFQHFEFDQMKTEQSRIFTPKNLGLIPFKNIVAMKTIAGQIADLVTYDSLPVIITGLDEMKDIFLKYFPGRGGVITQLSQDFFEKTCVEVMRDCREARPQIMDFYSAKLRERLLKLRKNQRVVSDLAQIIRATALGNIVQLVLPSSKKLWGHVDFATGEFALQQNPGSVDIYNELAEEVIRQGGKIQILNPHHFPQDAEVLAIFKVGA